MCSISFRHELVSFHDLVSFACRMGFDGIEPMGNTCKIIDAQLPSGNFSGIEQNANKRFTHFNDQRLHRFSSGGRSIGVRLANMEPVNFWIFAISNEMSGIEPY